MEPEKPQDEAPADETDLLKLDDLPDEILIHITKWLPRVADIVQLGRVSNRFVVLARDEALWHDFLITKWGLYPDRVALETEENTWKQLTLDFESLIGSWYGHASQDDWPSNDGFTMLLEIFSAKPDSNGELLLKGKMTWIDLDGAETSVTGRVTREKVNPLLVKHLHLDSPFAQMYDVKILELTETEVITDSPGIVPSTYKATLIRNSLIGGFHGSSEEHNYSCSGQFVIDRDESLPEETNELEQLDDAMEAGDDEKFFRIGADRLKRHTQQVVDSMRPGSVWVGVARDSALGEHCIEIRCIPLQAEDKEKHVVKVTVRPPSALQMQEIDEETDEPIHSHEGAIDSFMVPLQWLEIRHFSLDGELITKTSSAIYALSYDQECFTIMDHESTNASPQMELAPFRYFGRFNGAESDAISLMYSTALSNEKYMYHGDIIPHRGAAHLILQK
eukprot:TRINITY_DN458_c0_g1_i2.p1 TRINITY_DN458_c0_g1~~TRINITY_DN458_c0_g1_i2.p1  ORF type:complete len:449 (+),score=77.03 TRINITY_DN458_c0_g1_i2:38-1384(+)